VIQRSVGHYNKELVLILLDNGVDINEPDDWGRTTLQLTEQRILQAERNGGEDLDEYLDFASWLKAKGAN